MNLIEFFQLEHKRLQKELRGAVKDLTLQEWNTLPEGTGNNIAFLVWHCVRTEDLILNLVLQRQPPIWNKGGWPEQLHLPAREQGTGMDRDEARAFRLNDPERFMLYAEEVWRAYDSYLAGITDGGAELSSRMVTLKVLGEMPAILAIGQACIAHCFIHIGEIALLRGMLEKRGMSI